MVETNQPKANEIAEIFDEDKLKIRAFKASNGYSLFKRDFNPSVSSVASRMPHVILIVEAIGDEAPLGTRAAINFVLGWRFFRRSPGTGLSTLN